VRDARRERSHDVSRTRSGRSHGDAQRKAGVLEGEIRKGEVDAEIRSFTCVFTVESQRDLLCLSEFRMPSFARQDRVLATMFV
jgi:hypothetical protein